VFGLTFGGYFQFTMHFKREYCEAEISNF